MNEPDWDDLRHFAAFVRDRSLSAAARRLGVDHVTVARRLRALEGSLRVKLVDRRARIPALTAEGERVAALVGQVESAVDAIARAARGLQPEVGGDVSISAPPTIANALVAPRLPALRARHPELRIHLLGEKRIASLSRREADVAVRLVRPVEAGLVTRKLGGFQFALYGAKRYLAGRRSADLELIAFDDESDALPQQKWLRSLAGARPIVLRTNDLESQLAAARAGVGVAALPSFLARRHPELERVAIRARPIAREVWLVVHDDLRAAPSIRAVIDFLVEATAELRR
ncbi:MAG TPA: LysR family transcriptional regulator [Kofleriaceae bacterium]|nr:LysR family transcriptional regulator [Kofleriaceae bacterium]